MIFTVFLAFFTSSAHRVAQDAEGTDQIWIKPPGEWILSVEVTEENMNEEGAIQRVFLNFKIRDPF